MLSFELKNMLDINIWALLGTGFVAGLIGAMIGVGGGILMVPMMTLVLGFPMQVAIGSSLISIVINACTATSVYIRSHVTNLKLALLLATTLVPGAFVGGMLASLFSSPVLSFLFGILLLYVAYTLIPKKPRKKPGPAENIEPVREKEHASHAWLDGRYHDPAIDEDINYQAHHPGIGMLIGFFSGIISSLLGVGGGAINVPVMNLLMKVPIKAAIATSALLLCITTMTGSLIFAHNGYIYPFIVAPLIPGIYVGARLGASLAHRVRSAVLIRIFVVFVAITAVLMILKAFNMLGK
ncbi:MAG: sulfite exporter TauE/SafE family protein [Dehalococcoidia bacterium]|nr:sulfite exporter TauE/SafE family protein [Dehalococcoidia bacterium]MDD5493334.1 sulfite exporter TauE/SafE family protein [Dehalococcoidia bacterium]